MAQPRFIFAALIAVSVMSTSSTTADGVLEINQACALNGGCFPGDSSGFPVTITSPGSYRLTGSLDLSGLAPVTAVQVSAPAVHLDLGGFEIVGPTTCTGSGSTISCNPTGIGQGVEFFTASLASSVRNGTIRGFGDSGVAANPEGMRISDITAIHNGNDGFAGVRSALIENCVAMENGGDGFDSDRGSVLKDLMAIGNGNHGIEIDDVVGVVSGSTSQSNGGRGFNIVALSKYGQDNLSNFNGMEDDCGGGICTTARRFYLTETRHQGNSALGACTSGFRMAAIQEMTQLSALRYDYKLGVSNLDSPFGTPAWPDTWGWARTGRPESSGTYNCLNWTTNSGGSAGTIYLVVHSFVLNDRDALWSDSSSNCDVEERVWCIEE